MAAPAPAMQRETVALVVVAVLLAVAGMRLRLISAGDKSRQAIDVVRISRILLTIVVPRLRIARRIWLLLVALIGLRVAWLLVARRMRLAAELRLCIVLAVIVAVVLPRLAAVGTRLLERLILPQLLLRCGDQTKIMLGVLIVIFRRHRVARRGRI